jgi:hypothetical protein
MGSLEALFILRRVGILSVVLLFVCCRLCRFRVAGNGLELGAVADFGAQNCQYTTKVDAR